MEDSLRAQVSKFSENPLKTQVGGDHYKSFKIQPIEFFIANQTPYAEAAIIKYVLRYKQKNGVEDLRKAIHLCEILIDNYKENNNVPRGVSEQKM